LEINGNKVEFQIWRCETSLPERAGRDWSDRELEETKLHKKTIGKKAKAAGFRDYIKCFCKFKDKLLIFSAGVETTADQLITPSLSGTFKDPPETPYVKFVFLFRSGCMHPTLSFTADSRLLG
jgi:hypothetical protein